MTSRLDDSQIGPLCTSIFLLPGQSLHTTLRLHPVPNRYRVHMHKQSLGLYRQVSCSATTPNPSTVPCRPRYAVATQQPCSYWWAILELRIIYRSLLVCGHPSTGRTNSLGRADWRGHDKVQCMCLSGRCHAFEPSIRAGLERLFVLSSPSLSS